MSRGTQHYWLLTEPFAREAEARFRIATRPLRMALSRVRKHFEDDVPLIAVIGRPHVGKTALRVAFENSVGSGTKLARILDPVQSWDEIEQELAEQLGAPPGIPSQWLLDERRAGHKTLVIFDAAEEIAEETLVHLDALLARRRPSGIESVAPQILLLLRPPDDHAVYAWLDRHAAVMVQLEPLDLAETRRYIERRIRLAADGDREIFTPQAIAEIQRCTRGTPGAINELCGACIELAATRDEGRIGPDLVLEEQRRRGPLPDEPAIALDTFDGPEHPALPAVGDEAESLANESEGREALAAYGAPSVVPPSSGLEERIASERPAVRRLPRVFAIAAGLLLLVGGGVLGAVGASRFVSFFGASSASVAPPVATAPSPLAVAVPAPRAAPVAAVLEPAAPSLPASPPARPDPTSLAASRRPAIEEPVAALEEAALEKPAQVAFTAPEATGYPDASQDLEPVATTVEDGAKTAPGSVSAPIRVASTAAPGRSLRAAPPAVSARADAPLAGADRILANALRKASAPDQARVVRLLAVGDEGPAQVGVLKLARKQIGGRVHTMAILTSTGGRPEARLLSIRGPDASEERVAYLPEQQRAIPLGSGGDSGGGSEGSSEDPFHDTGFRYEDFELPQPELYEATRLERSEIAGEEVHIVTLRRRTATASASDRIELFVANDSAILERRHFEDGTRAPVRTIESPRSGLQQVGEYWIPGRLIVRDERGDPVAQAMLMRTRSTLELADTLFTLAALRGTTLELSSL